jgi:hypothetical protein
MDRQGERQSSRIRVREEEYSPKAASLGKKILTHKKENVLLPT